MKKTRLVPTFVAMWAAPSAVLLATTTRIEAQEAALAPIQEVIVTAQKREQSIQTVGIAISAFDGDALRDRGIDQASRIDALTPNVSFTNESGGGVPVVIVRGVGLQNFRINDTPTTSFYIDEVYQPSVVSAEFTMFDLQRLELLKGPQGGLYGRNTIAGAVQILSRRPQVADGTQGYLTATYGRFDHVAIEGAAGTALSDTTAIRVAARSVSSGAHEYRSVSSGERSGAEDRLSGRVLLSFKPNENFDALLKLHAGKDNSQTPLLRPIGVFVDSGTADAIGAPNVSNGLIEALFGIPGGGYCASVRNGSGSDPATCAAVDGRTPDTMGLSSDFDSASRRPNYLDNSWHGASLIGTWTGSDYALTSITAFDRIDYFRHVDWDGVESVHQDIDYGSEIESYSQEFRLSHDGGGAVTWIAGLSYAQSKLVETTELVGTDGVVPLFYPSALVDQDYVQRVDAAAAYGHADWHLTDKLNLVTELRYTDEQVDFAGGVVFRQPDGTSTPGASTQDSQGFSAFSGKVALELMPMDDLLVFASASRGFKTGGFYGGMASSREQLEPFESETILAYEVGFKGTYADGRVRLGGSLFYYDRHDVQATARDTRSATNVSRLMNVGEVDTRGAELDLTWVPNDIFSLVASAGYLDAQYVSDGYTATGTLDLLPSRPLKGLNVPNYSKLSANLIGSVQTQISSALAGTLQIEYSYRSKRDLALIVNPLEEEPLMQERGYSLFNVRGKVFRDPRSGWEVAAFVDNVLDERYRSTARYDSTFGIYEIYAEPRTYGLSATYRWAANP